MLRKKQNRRKPQPLTKRLGTSVRPEKVNRKVVKDSFALLGMLVIFGCIALTTWGAGKMADPETLPIQQVRVEGDFQYLSRSELEEIISEKVDGGFFTLNVGEVRAAVLSMPWVQEVTVRKLWPDELYLTITEQKAVVRWGENGYLNQKGELFEPVDTPGPAGLIELSGPIGTHRMVYEKYRKLMGLLNTNDRAISWMSLNDRRGWRFAIKDGPTVVIGNKDVDARIWKYLNYVEVVIGEQADQIAQVDLRYSNGFTVKKQKMAEDEANQPREIKG